MLYSMLLFAMLLSPIADAAFSEATSRQLLYLGAGAYGTAANQNSCASKEGYTMVKQFNVSCELLGSTCSGYIVSKSSILYVIFGGSQDSVSILEQLLKAPTYTYFHGKGEVNADVAAAHEQMWPTVNATLRNHTNASVVFTGHGLGGSLATLAAARSVIDGVLNMSHITVWTFGEPRTENYGFVKWFNANVTAAANNIRVVHRNDHITRLTPCAFVPGSTTKCAQAAGNPYHRGTQYWYATWMTATAAASTACSDTDFTKCPLNMTAWEKPDGPYNDHDAYYLVNVPAYGKAGCK